MTSNTMIKRGILSMFVFTNPHHRRYVLALIGFSAMAFPDRTLSAQGSTASPAPLHFETVSVRVHDGFNGIAPKRLQWTATSYIAEGISLKWLIAAAYNRHFDFVAGIPAWISPKRFDVVAKVSSSDEAQFAGASIGEKNSMLQQFLKERFHLQTHVEGRLSKVFDLVPSSTGIKMHQASPDPINPNAHRLIFSHGQLIGEHVSSANLAGALLNVAGCKVIDKTGATGLWNFKLHWSPEEDLVSSSPLDSAAPPLATALREQLGIELKPAEATIDYVVVDRITMPTSN